MIRKILKRVVYYLHYLWIVSGIVAFMTLLELWGKSGESRASLANNRTILELLDSSSNAATIALFGMMVFLMSSRRKLKRGVIKRLGIRWQRILLGTLLPILIPAFLMRDIERLSQLPRGNTATKEQLRALPVTRQAFWWPAFVMLWVQVESPLNNALLGIVYITDGTATIDDPIRYALKWIKPETFTESLSKYAQYIWIGSVFYCLVIILVSIISWLLIEKYSRITRHALK